jgi:hypothetical protein
MKIKKYKKRLKSMERYIGTAYLGNFDLTTDYAVQTVLNCMEESLKGNPARIVGKFLHFFLKNPQLDNPITLSVRQPVGLVHPGQSRVIGAYFRKEQYIRCVFVPPGKDEQRELRFIKTIGSKIREPAQPLYKFGKDISVESFAVYFLGETKGQEYTSATNQALEQYLSSFFPIKWTFDNRRSIVYNESNSNEYKTEIHCKNALGFYESIIYLTNNGLKTDNFKIVKY